ncbi:MAG: hypothetical protein WCO44_08280 [Bacteroidota bacterium]
MKLNLRNRRVLSCALAMMILAVMAGSCRKDCSTTYIPANHSTSTSTPEAFSGNSLQMISDYEMTHNMAFPGGVMHSASAGLVQGTASGSGFKMIGFLMNKILNFKRKQHINNEFQDIDNALSIIQAQIATLDSNNVHFQQVLIKKVDMMTTLLTQFNLNQDITNIHTEYNITNNNYFGFYRNIATQWEQDTTSAYLITQMHEAAKSAPTWASNIINDKGSKSMLSTIQEMHDALIPTLPGTTTNALKAYATQLIDNLSLAHTTKVLDTQDALNLYCLLETYFITIMNYEYQAATVYSNACKVVDSTGVNRSDSIFKVQFGNQVVDQIKVFLKVVDYMVVNVAEYRDAARFQRDMRTEDMGIASDTVFGPALGRAQLVANLLCASVGKPYPVMNAVITTPRYYGNGAGPVTLSFAGRTATTNAVNWTSQLPCTRWTDSTCTSSNEWTINRLGTPGIADPPGLSGYLPVSIQNAWWNPWTTPSGHVQVYYYSPQNPTDKSVVQDSVHSVGLAFVACNWPWGTMYVDKAPAKSASYPGYFSYYTFESGLMDWPMFPTPSTVSEKAWMGATGELQLLHDGTFTTSSGCRIQNWQGTMSQAKYKYLMADGHWKNVKVGTALPAYNPGVQAWVTCSVLYTMKGTGKKTFLTLYAGTLHHNHFNAETTYWIGSEVISSQIQNQAGVTKIVFGNTALTAGTDYQPGISYCYETNDVPSAGVSGMINLTSSYQVVYGGFYDVPL